MRAHDVWTRHTTFVLIGLVTFVLTCWHFYGPILPSIAPAFPAFSHSRLPKYWSVTGKTGKGNSLEGITDFKRPEGLKIVALVFYGRPATVSILDCYLKVKALNIWLSTAYEGKPLTAKTTGSYKALKCLSHLNGPSTMLYDPMIMQT